MFGIILLCRRQPACPRKVVVTVPAHTDTVQSLDLLLGQAARAFSAANLPLQLQPRAKAQPHRRFVSSGDVQIAVFGVVDACLRVVVVPRRGQAALQLLKQNAAVMQLLHNLKAIGDNLVPLAVGVQALHGGGHFILQAADAGQPLEVVDHIQNQWCSAVPCRQGAPDLLLVDDGRNGWAEQNHARNARNVYALVEHINAEQQL